MRSRRFSVVRRQPQMGRRNQRHDAGEAEELHGDVGDDRAGTAEQVADRRRGRVVEAGIGDRPGHQRRAGGDERGEHAEADELRRSPLRRLPQRVGQVVQKRERRGAHRSTARPGPRRTRAAQPERLGGAS